MKIRTKKSGAKIALANVSQSNPEVESEILQAHEYTNFDLDNEPEDHG